MSQDPRSLRIADYTYELPDERIARYPLPERDAAKLLVYRNGEISEDIFRRLPLHMPEGAVLVLNTAKVVRARMLFQKPSGGAIELFCLEPHPQYADITTAMAVKGEILWQCLVGGAAKWKEDTTLSLQAGDLTVWADLHTRNRTDFTIRFRWGPGEYSWAEVMEAAGQVPLPPYLGRDAEPDDVESYQTLFAQHEGSVAAPTASLHFTPGVLDSLESMGIKTVGVTLHVGAGTFRPIKSEVTGEHEMHGEWIEVSRETLEELITAKAAEQPIVAGGTTALRTLESLYWLGCKASSEPDISPAELKLGQWQWCDSPSSFGGHEALEALRDWLARQGKSRLITRTEILITPGYRFRMAEGLITNFHQPQSTLLLLVAAFIGGAWKRVYDYALEHGFRFLSYGDGSLLWRRE